MEISQRDPIITHTDIAGKVKQAERQLDPTGQKESMELLTALTTAFFEIEGRFVNASKHCRDVTKSVICPAVPSSKSCIKISISTSRSRMSLLTKGQGAR